MKETIKTMSNFTRNTSNINMEKQIKAMNNFTRSIKNLKFNDYQLKRNSFRTLITIVLVNFICKINKGYIVKVYKEKNVIIFKKINK